MITIWALFISQLFQFETIILEGFSDSSPNNAINVEGRIKDDELGISGISFR